jgi:hypothetical protein
MVKPARPQCQTNGLPKDLGDAWSVLFFPQREYVLKLAKSSGECFDRSLPSLAAVIISVGLRSVHPAFSSADTRASQGNCTQPIRSYLRRYV